MASLIRTILCFVACFAIAACDKGSGPAGQENAAAGEELVDGEAFESESGLVGRLDISKRGEAMIDAPFADPNGKTVQLSDFTGKPLLVNIWATWCAPCIVEMPMLDKLAIREKDRLKVLVVSQDIQGREKVDPFFEKSGFVELESYLDTENNLSFGFETGVMPTTVLYDARGKEVWRVVGAMDWDGARAATLMEDTLAGG